MLEEKIIDRYPHERPARDTSGRRYQVLYDLAYDGGGSEWRKGYRTLWGARVAVWWNMYVASWGGSALIADTKIKSGDSNR